MAKRDFYETLGVARTADEGELKSAFRKLAMQCHPDRNPGDKECEHRFKEINEAYDVLKDAEKRAAYDRFGHAAFEQAGGGGHGFGADFASTFSDIFDDLFGMGGGAPRRSGSGRERGADLRYNWRSRSKRRFTARPRRSACRLRSPAKPAPAPAPRPARKPKTCTHCGGTGACASNRASSPSSAPARPARAAAR